MDMNAKEEAKYRKIKEEAKYLQTEQKKAIKAMTSAGWNESYTVQLRIAFRRGYNAKDKYDRQLLSNELKKLKEKRQPK